MGYTMDGFRKAVKNLMRKKEKDEEKEAEKEKESKPYLVRVKIPDLNIRKGPGTNYPKTGKYTGVGTFTIVDCFVSRFPVSVSGSPLPALEEIQMSGVQNNAGLGMSRPCTMN